jgi:ketosteroid isomerase-like protein
MTENGALAVVREYHRAWTSGDFAAAGRCLADDLDVEVPINAYADRDEFMAAVRGFAELVRRVDLLAAFERGDEAMLLYDMDAGPFGDMRVAEHFTVSGGLIRRVRQIHDTAAIRAAGAG